MLRNHRRSGLHAVAPDSFEARASGFPAHGVRERAIGQSKWRYIAGNIERLDAILCVCFAGGVAPTAELDVQFAVVLVASPVIKSVHAQNGGGFQVSGVANNDNVSP